MKLYESENGKKVEWESNSDVIWQNINVLGLEDKSSKEHVRMGSGTLKIRIADQDYRLDLSPSFAPTAENPYPKNLRAELIFAKRPGGRTAPDKILVWGLRGAVATTFVR